MPLLVLTGFPASGKSTIVNRIAKFFKERGFLEEIEIVSDDQDSTFQRSVFADFKKEKEVRNLLRSNVQRLLDKKTLVICDSLNSIKGYRYELFCLAKNTETTYALLHCDSDPGTSKWLNEQRPEESRYPSDEILRGLIGRYERPDPKNRWDSPLFIVKIGEEAKKSTDMVGSDFDLDELLMGDRDRGTDCTGYRHLEADDFQPQEIRLPAKVPLPLEELFSCLAQGKSLSANQCMRPMAPAAKGTFLSELDAQTQGIVNRLVEAQRRAIMGDQLVVLDGELGRQNKVNFTRHRSLPQLTRVRQQFVAYTRAHPIEDANAIGALFVGFLNANC